ncbi:MAG: zinc transporter ZntB [Azospirillum sp.]|nr:zinc transporter ZntB [Azospirillum sp.]
METLPLLEPGQEPGLRFACVIDGKGGAVEHPWAEIDGWRPDQGVLWIHLERDHPAAQEWMRNHSGIDPVIAEALIAEESRPRVESCDDALLIVLRGICKIRAGVESELGTEGCDLVPIHIWIDGHRVISLRDCDHQLTALRDIRNAYAVGKGPCRQGELLVQIADKIVKDLEPVLDDMDEEVDRLEDHLLDPDEGSVRFQLSNLRRRSIHLRRYLAPQRDALNRLQHEDPSWLTERDKVRLREVTDKVLRFIEYLDSIRDRSTILHEDMTGLITERIARTSNRLTALAALLLPPSLIAGLLGMNVGGIPGAADPIAFIIVVVVVVVLTLGILWGLRRLDWL